MAWTKGQFVGTIWFCAVFTLILVCLRLYVRLTTVHRPYRELLLVFAWIGYFVIVICNTYQSYNEEIWALTEGKPVPDYVITLSYKITFAWLFILTTALNACKAVLLLTYSDLCPRHVFPKLWWTIFVTIVLVAVCEVALGIIYTFLQCMPTSISAYWSSTEICWDQNFLVVIWISNTATDLIISIIPVFIVRQLSNLTFSKKVGVAAMFAAGFSNVILVVCITIAFLPGRFFPNSQVGIAFNSWGGIGAQKFANLLILPTAIIVICIPQLRIVGRWKYVRKALDSVRKLVGAPLRADKAPSEFADCKLEDIDLKDMQTSTEEKPSTNDLPPV